MEHFGHAVRPQATHDEQALEDHFLAKRLWTVRNLDPLDKRLLNEVVAPDVEVRTGPPPRSSAQLRSALYLRNMNGGWRNDGRGHTIVAHVRDFYPDLDLSPFLDLGCSVGHSMIAIAAGCPDASFDIVTSSVVLHETSASAMRAIFAECHRLLRPGGVMVHLEVPPRREHLGLWEQMRCDFESHYNNEPFMAAMSRTDFADVARRAGFRPADITVGYRHGVAEPRAERADFFTAGDPEGRNMLGSWYVCSARKVQA